MSRPFEKVIFQENTNNGISDSIILCLKINRQIQNLIINEITRIDEEIEELKKVQKIPENTTSENYFKIKRNFFINNPLAIPSYKWTKTEDRQIYNIGLVAITPEYFPLQVYEFLNIKYDQKKFQPGFIEINPLEFCDLFNHKKSLFQIYQRWINFLHPSISKSQFSASENAKIIRYAHVYGLRNWHLIGLQMESIRRPWQCLTQFQQCFNKEMWFSEWNDEEDRLLLLESKKYIEIDWTEISKLFRWKTNEQCRLRYNYLTDNPASTEKFPIFTEYIRGNLTSFGILQAFVFKYYNNSRNNKWTKEEDKILIDSYDLFKGCYGIWSKISQIFLNNRSRHAVIKRFSIICQEVNFERLYNDVWSRKNLISNFSFGNRQKSEFNELGVFGIPQIPRAQINKHKMKCKKDSSIFYQNNSIYSDYNQESIIKFNEIFDFWFEKFVHIQDLSQRVLKYDWSKFCDILDDLTKITNVWSDLNPHNFKSLDDWNKISLQAQNEIQRIINRVNSLD